MKIVAIPLLGLVAGSAAAFAEDPHVLTLRDLGVHNAAAQDYILSLRDLDDRNDHYLRARSLDEHGLDPRQIAEAVTIASRGLLHRRTAMAEALARGGGGGGKSKGSGKGGGSAGATKPKVKGLSKGAEKAGKDCMKAQKSKGDCGAMKGMFAEAGCTLGFVLLL